MSPQRSFLFPCPVMPRPFRGRLIHWIACLLLVWVVGGDVRGDTVAIVNSGFEDTSGQTTFNEFTFGIPAGWTQYDPSSIDGGGVFWGTLLPNGVDFFDQLAPEGDRVALLFNSTREGDGEYGISQLLSETLQANTRYELTVEVGNIASGFATNGTFYNLDEFPGYRVDLLAGGVVIAQDDNSLSIAEGEFATSTVTFEVGATHANLGDALSIRLVNLNAIPSGYSQATSPDLEVDFDDVQLRTTSIPEPSSWLALGGLGFGSDSPSSVMRTFSRFKSASVDDSGLSQVPHSNSSTSNF